MRAAIEAVFRIESARLVAALTRFTRDVGLAEELAQDALVAALEQWPASGVPDNPGAWLTAAAKHKAVDRFRKDALVAQKHAALASTQPTARAADFETARDDEVGDDLLRLVFISCHPVLPTEGRVALTLRLLGGLTTEEIARAFLVPEPTVAQRIVRAKRVLAEAQVPFELPARSALHERLASVLEVLYLIFNEGYSATAGDDVLRPALCDEAMRLCRVLGALMPNEAEVHGLLALTELQASRFGARTDASGAPILLADQNRGLWNRLLISRGLASLEKAEALAPQRGPYTLQAALAACHARAPTVESTDWARIVGLYGELALRHPSPVVDLNRAVALGMLMGPASGLAIVDALAEDGSLEGYHFLDAVRGDLLTKLGRHREAQEAFLRAASMTKNQRERALLEKRAKASEAE